MVRGLGDLPSLVVGGKVPGPGQGEGRMGYRLSFLFTQGRTRRFSPEVKVPEKRLRIHGQMNAQLVEALRRTGGWGQTVREGLGVTSVLLGLAGQGFVTTETEESRDGLNYRSIS